MEKASDVDVIELWCIGDVKMKGGEKMYQRIRDGLKKEARILQGLGLEEYEIDYLISQRVKQIIRIGWEEN